MQRIVTRVRSGLVAAGVAVVLAHATGCAEQAGPVHELSGQQLYEHYCARCHGVDGRPVPEQPQARNLSDRRIVDNLSDESIEMTIRMGREPAMPAFRDQFTEASLQVLVAYVRSLSGSRGTHAKPAGRAAP
ncbi:MAG: cytochrome c [Deltaproteobacteria bacterium]|nr:cytochrome c [Deltaproteobacteria bacterium]MBK8237244.1 cytochrome c [Deltaproteobacteria bacterium]MBK8718936.1 cytochrome c [Deltaproteobacteria bacterium]MBP7289217.1 cytochrome c [Nannocystaceae bacterium]